MSERAKPTSERGHGAGGVRTKALARIREAVGAAGWIDEAAPMAPYLAEPRGLYRGSAAAVVRPAATAEVAAVVAACAEAGIAVVPQGGNTGLVGGGVPADGAIVLSLERMRAVRALDPVNFTVTVEAGCVLAEVQAAAAAADRLFPLSLGAEGSCRIGGNLSTNAGGVNVLRYGTARDLVLGLEVVLADGSVWDGLRGLRKDNTGYDLKQLFIGAEGTLGVLTAAVLKLFPRPRGLETGLAAVADPGAAVALFTRVREATGDRLTACELIPRIGLAIACRHVPGVRDPLAAPHPWYVLLEVSRFADDAPDALARALAPALEDGLVGDATIAASAEQARGLWRIREGLVEAQRHEGGSIKHDVALPLSNVAAFLAVAEAEVAAAIPGVRVVAFGHLGDGNIHFNLSQPPGADRAAFLARWGEIARLVHDRAVAMGGSFSAEHGIGLLKRADLVRYRSAVEISLMRRIKAALDPAGLMNPGKVV